MTSPLEAGTAQIARKVGEEAVEAVVAALTYTGERVLEEAADLVFTCTSCSPPAAST